ncbi:DUF3869 domain-containing protein [Bacteroides heparinolyticus]|uniref:DUF3869 domain-containing protein n=1 Tax=Prevotella heparinolytica TaxID=28113 RepID=A0A3P2A4A0_9BACE|nr:DUF3869 domain-containing protein [Bacteroides heparinolyticus]RRD90277.1 DUF3869 domain-containing protein [Bacteroides heparinolyticus]
MKKIKFLNGINAMFALAVVALATTFTSCEKEEFNVNVDPINAQATISPIVLYVADGVTTDVTSTAKITYNPNSVFTGNPALAATTATVSVSYDGMSADVKVAIPALQAGQFATLTPTIMLQKKTPETKVEIFQVAGDAVTVPSEKVGESVNATDYWYSTTAKYLEKSGNKVMEKKVLTEDVNEIAAVYALFSTLENTYKEVWVEKADVPVYAHSLTKLTVTYTVATTEYKIVKKTTTVTKADGEIIIGTAKVENYITTTSKIEHSLQIPGHNHAPAGHGHGHGHGDDANAGGGIVIAD